MSADLECSYCGGPIVQKARIEGRVQILEVHEDGSTTECIYDTEDEWQVDDLYDTPKCAGCGSEVELW